MKRKLKIRVVKGKRDWEVRFVKNGRITFVARGYNTKRNASKTLIHTIDDIWARNYEVL